MSNANSCRKSSKGLDCTTPQPQWWYETDDPVSIRLGLHMTLLYTEESPYQKLAVYEHEILGRVLVLDDIVQTTQADEFIYHEMFVHVPLLGRRFATRSNSQVDVLIIGGGDGGILREVLRHPFVSRVVMVEIDEAVIRVSREYLGIQGDYDDPRVTLIIDDAFHYIQSQQATDQPFDLILVDATDPVGPGKILYSKDFYHKLDRCLKSDGLVVRHLGLPFLQAQVLQDGVANLKRVFGHVQVYRTTVPTYICGEMAFAAANRAGYRINEPHVAFEARFYNREVHHAAFALPTYWQRLIADDPSQDRGGPEKRL